MTLAYAAGGFRETVDKLVELEAAGLDAVGVAELYSFDAVSQLGYIAAKTSRLTIESGIVQIYTRTPALTAMTAAGLDYVSDGRFVLGMGASGPQVIEGFHGLRYDAPVGRTREIVEICRKVWRREKLEYAGKHYQVASTDFINANAAEAKTLVNQGIQKLTGKPIAQAVIDAAWGNMTFTNDPVASSLRKGAADAISVGLLDGKTKLDGIYDLTILNNVLKAAGKPQVAS